MDYTHGDACRAVAEGSDFQTLWDSPRRMANFLRSWQFSCFHCHPNLFARKVSTHFHFSFSSFMISESSFSVEGVPKNMFRHDAMQAAKSATLLTDATTACNMCLKARTIISCIQSDWTWGSLSASSTYNDRRKGKNKASESSYIYVQVNSDSINKKFRFWIGK